MAAKRLAHRARNAWMAALIVVGGSGLLAAHVLAKTTPTVTVAPEFLAFPKEALDHSSPPETATVSASGAAVEIKRLAITAGKTEDFRIVSTTCHKKTLQPGQSCAVKLVFRPSTLWQHPVGFLHVLSNAAPALEALSGVVPLALKFSSHPQNSTGSPLIVTALVNSNRYRFVNVFVNGKFDTDCEGRSCQVSLSAEKIGETVYHVAADASNHPKAKPDGKWAVISRRETFDVHLVPPSCPGGNCM